MADAVRMHWLDGLPRLHAVQTEGAAPLARAWKLLRDRMGGDPSPAQAEQWMAMAAAHADELMWPWEATPKSVAYGILDDVTYDWLEVVDGMVRSGGSPLVVSEDVLLRANQLARVHTAIDADHTATAGLAGLLQLNESADAPSDDETIAVLFTGVTRLLRRDPRYFLKRRVRAVRVCARASTSRCEGSRRRPRHSEEA
jgi:threonine synthase